MNLKINTLLSDLNEQLNFIDIEFDDTINRCEKAIEIIIVSIHALLIKYDQNICLYLDSLHFFKSMHPSPRMQFIIANYN